VHLVHMINALSPDAYVWYLSRFGRTSPLAVDIALLPLLQKGVPDQDGRLQVSYNGSRFVVTVDGDRIVRWSEAPHLAPSSPEGPPPGAATRSCRLERRGRAPCPSRRQHFAEVEVMLSHGSGRNQSHRPPHRRRFPGADQAHHYAPCPG